uniref:Uncharacterized protein n=1 Tax=Anguilla anguilla TaxID=7936 RepID=A0A0E9X912_ANGAN
MNVSAQNSCIFNVLCTYKHANDQTNRLERDTQLLRIVFGRLNDSLNVI